MNYVFTVDPRKTSRMGIHVNKHKKHAARAHNETRGTYCIWTPEVESVVGDQHFAFHRSVEWTDVDDLFVCVNIYSKYSTSQELHFTILYNLCFPPTPHNYLTSKDEKAEEREAEVVINNDYIERSVTRVVSTKQYRDTRVHKYNPNVI